MSVAGPPMLLNRTAARRAARQRRLAMLGPAFVAAIAYVDPGNFATNIAAGSSYGYLLLWVIVVANCMAIFVQSLSAKLGLATGASLPELCRQHYRRSVVIALWAQAEVVAVATDLAEVVGGAVALRLLFGLPFLTGGLITGVAAFAILALQTRSNRRFALAITVLLAVILVGFAVLLTRVSVDPRAVLSGLVPKLDGAESLLLSAGILGATVMPHAVYLHSALIPASAGGTGVAQRRRALGTQRAEVTSAMGLAGVINAVMLIVAAALFFDSGRPGTGTLVGAHTAIGQMLGGPAAALFAIALLASGFASASVGTYAGQVIMDGFLRRRMRLLTRRALTLLPALVVIALGVEPTRALVLSQVALSFGIPFALVPLVLLTSRRDVMADLVNRRSTTLWAAVVTAVIVALNVVLLFELL